MVNSLIENFKEIINSINIYDERIKKFISKNVNKKEKRFISGLLSDPKIQDIAILAARHSASADGFHILEKKKFDYWVKFWDL